MSYIYDANTSCQLASTPRKHYFLVTPLNQCAALVAALSVGLTNVNVGTALIGSGNLSTTTAYPITMLLKPNPKNPDA